MKYSPEPRLALVIRSVIRRFIFPGTEIWTTGFFEQVRRIPLSTTGGFLAMRLSLVLRNKKNVMEEYIIMRGL
jgi:hypothetical protein